jgi:sRNA-binding carbon storage regulator CsrA
MDDEIEILVVQIFGNSKKISLDNLETQVSNLEYCSTE